MPCGNLVTKHLQEVLMQRRRLLFLTSLAPLALLTSRRLKAFNLESEQPIDYREKADRLNQLAAGIHTVADARLLVDFVANLFSKELPPSAINNNMRAKVAEAEFAAATDSQRLIPEQRVAEAWNAYALTIGTPPERQVTVAEIHNVRDAFFATANLSWTRGGRNIWAVPAIYATEKGELAGGCRAIEAARILWDLANMPGNLESARVRVSHGLLFSDTLRETEARSVGTTQARGFISAGPGRRNPVEDAERDYVTRKGMRAFRKAVVTMLDQTLG
jgi:hypothetical protein